MEKSLEEKRTHCKLNALWVETVQACMLMMADVKVVKAFESALALLSGA